MDLQFRRARLTGCLSRPQMSHLLPQLLKVRLRTWRVQEASRSTWVLGGLVEKTLSACGPRTLVDLEASVNTVLTETGRPTRRGCRARYLFSSLSLSLSLSLSCLPMFRVERTGNLSSLYRIRTIILVIVKQHLVKIGRID